MQKIQIKTLLIALITGLLLTAMPLGSRAMDMKSVTPTEETAIANSVARLHEIEQMDKSKLTKQERKSLRKEVRDIRASTKHTGGGVYISAGALLIVILLLILL